MALARMDSTAAATLELREDALAGYNDDVQRRLAGTEWSAGGWRSWYLDANGRNTTL